MRYLLAVSLILSLGACSSARLKKCEARATDPALQVCREKIQGAFFMCEKPEHLYLCEDPQ